MLAPPLTRQTLAAASCKICGSRATEFDVADFNKFCSHEDFYAFGFSGIRVDYLRCTLCGCIFTEFFDAWTARDFSENVYNSDYIKVDSEYAEVRPRLYANEMARRWGDCHGARILDYGSGTGVFADELQKLGYLNVTSYDPFSNPERPEGEFDIITCFEVIEHTPSPVEAMQDICKFLRSDGCIIFSQTLQPDNIGDLRGSWWYLAPRNGHICTFTSDSLAFLAQRCGLTFCLGGGPYAFLRPTLSQVARDAVSTMGKPYHFMPLFAPLDTDLTKVGGTFQWHHIEVAEAQSFRWSGAARLCWPAPRLPYLPATVRFAIPFLDRLSPEILEGIRVSLGQSHGSFKRSGNLLIAEISVDKTSGSVVVDTRQLTSPRALRGDDDDRTLGMAVLTDPVHT